MELWDVYFVLILFSHNKLEIVLAIPAVMNEERNRLNQHKEFPSTCSRLYDGPEIAKNYSSVGVGHQ